MCPSCLWKHIQESYLTFENYTWTSLTRTRIFAGLWRDIYIDLGCINWKGSLEGSLAAVAKTEKVHL